MRAPRSSSSLRPAIGAAALAVACCAALVAGGTATAAPSPSPSPTTALAGAKASASAKESAKRATLEAVIAAPNGTAGLPITVTVVAPKLANQDVSLQATLGSTNADIDEVSLDARGRGAISWTPPLAGTWSITAPNAQVPIQGSSPVIGAMPTSTTIVVPNRATRFEPLTLLANVDTGATVRTLGEAAAKQSTQITGTVTFYEVYLGRLGAVDVKALPGQAVASFEWTPPIQGDYAFYAVFTPTDGTNTSAGASTSGTPTTGPVSTAGSMSPVAYLTVLERPTIVALRMPQVIRVGQPAVIGVDLPTMFRGTVSFLVDDEPISPDREAEFGKTGTVWTPLAPGLRTVTVELQSALFPRLERRVEQQVQVLPELVPNPISVTPVIKGEPQDPWEDGSVLVVQGGTRIPLVMSTGSGAPVNLAQRGGCLVSGSTLLTPAAGGGCLITFSTVGSGGLGPNSASVVISAEVEPEQGKAGAKGDGRVVAKASAQASARATASPAG